MTNDELKNLCLIEIEKILNSNVRSLRDYLLMTYLDLCDIRLFQNKLIEDELAYNTNELTHTNLYTKQKMTHEQRLIFGEIVNVVIADSSGFYFVYGYGGCGKTFIWNGLSSAIRNIGSVVGDESEVNIIDNLLITTTDDPLSHSSKAILTPTLESVKKVNDFVWTIFLRMEKEYLSSDTTYQADENENVQQEWFTPEFLNDIKCLGLPNHKLTLKPGVIIMLLRDIDQTSVLYNGTRLIVNKLGNNVIGATVVTGRNIGDKVYILRMNLIPSDSGLPFKFQRRQFSLTMCFAMTSIRVRVNHYHI
ncbi:uncharacterized protein LOC107620798 [Arachis ipaensis]|uniref:uncharacterized protein LOC107620798 n=1 Tax=Arachis ipaensis TaxID=130454 RepID=UPI000A2B3AE1|nr:uncharacterized protein LOC107620798 [Arachis ipaensis]